MANRTSAFGSRRRALAGGFLTAASVMTVLIALVFTMVGQRVAADNPDAQEYHLSFINDTGAPASNLEIVYGVPVKKPIVQEEVGGCPEPSASVEGSTVVIEWDEKCVEPGEKVLVTVFSKEPIEFAESATWGNNSVPSLTAAPPTTGTPPASATAPSDGPTSTFVPPPTVGLPPTPIPGVPPVPTSTQVPGPGPLPTTVLEPTSTAAQPAMSTPTATPSLGSGDVNCDDNVNSIDAALLLQFIAGLLASLDCDDAADVNQNGAVDSIDVAIMLQFVAGLVARLPV